MGVRRIVSLEQAVDRALGVVADAQGVTIEALLEAAARHIARTMGGLRQPVYRLRSADADLPDLDAPREIPLPPRPAYNLSPESLARSADVCRLYRDEQKSLREVSEILGISSPTVRRILEHAQVTIRPQGSRPGTRLGGQRVG